MKFLILIMRANTLGQWNRHRDSRTVEFDDYTVATRRAIGDLVEAMDEYPRKEFKVMIVPEEDGEPVIEIEGNDGNLDEDIRQLHDSQREYAAAQNEAFRRA